MNSLLVRSQVDFKSSYKDYREELRKDFWYSCAYCSLTEIEAKGIGFEIDHYHPTRQFLELKNKYDNLYWSCSKCNGFKGGYFPNDRQKARGYFIIRPDYEFSRDYYEIDKKNKFYLKEKNETGNFNIRKLSLNSQLLVRIRSLRNNLSASNECIASGFKELLAFDIDNLPQKYRAMVISMQKSFEKKYERQSNSIVDLILAFSRSELLDEDVNKKTTSKERRIYLKSIDAIVPDQDPIDLPKIKTSVSKRRKKAKK
jgi:hypothetical protein